MKHTERSRIHSGKMRYFVENWVFPVISVKSVNFQLLHDFLLKNSERYSICLKKLVFLLKQTIFHDKTSVGRRLSFENWLKSGFSLKLVLFHENLVIFMEIH